ncbi:hypothetical protein ACFV4E_22430 [Streptomyces hygroscopicus]|uniref:Uncharacterized protein n=1 Tax=Streptomyces hygroscopicus TaxID=1912 RepID=A0ABQ3UFG3_STRHY|nr:hypothetical protein [Streptomyces hygroscopicus]GHJ34353.1 hypothetical protein TPA0910_87860 [Streptomyces hygroscopicus]GHJ34368.1 hypothetical protein TPA0910_88010 [Streptomyces hygroscopicus]
MSQWNLSVRLTGQGTSLTRTLRDASREARALSRDINAVRRDITQLRQAARRDIRIDVRVDAARLRADVQRAVRDAGRGSGITIPLSIDATRLRADIRRAVAAGGTGSRVDIPLRVDGSRLRADIRRQVSGASTGQRINIRLGIDSDGLRRDVEAALTVAGAGQGLNVRLGIDAARLRRDVQSALAAAGAGQGLNVRLGIDADGLRRDVQTALTAAGAGQGVRVPLNIDAGRLRDEVRAALTTAGAGQGLGISLHLTNAMQLRRDVADAVRWAAWGHRIEIPLVLANQMGLRRDVTNAVRWASMNQVINVRVRADTSGLGDLNLPNLGGGRGGGGGGLNGLLLLAPTVIPLVAGLTANLAPLATQLGVAGVAGAAFGIALAGQVGPLGEVADAEKKYQEAVVQHGRTSKEAQEAARTYQQQLAQLPPETQKAAVALSSLKRNFSEWSDDMSGFTMAPLTKGMTVLDTLIPRLTPQVQSASTQLDRLVTVAGGAVQTPGFDAMADRFADFTDRQLDEMTDKVIHFMRLLSEGQSPANGPIAEFIAYARQNGPAAREAMQAISAALVTLLRGASEAGPTMLTLVTALARLVAALPPELVGIIIQVATALKLLQLSGAGMAALAAGIGRVRAQIIALSATAAGAGGGLAGLRAAFLSLGTAAKASIAVAGVAAAVVVLTSLSNIGRKAPPDVDKLTTSLGNLGKTGKVSGEALRSFGNDLGGLSDSLRTLSRPSNAEKTQQFLTKLIGMDSTPVKEAKQNLDAVDKALAKLVQGGKADLAQAAFNKVAAAMRKQGLSTGELRDKLDNYKSALADQKFEQELAAQAMGLFGKAAQDTQSKLDAQKASADGLRQSIQALNDVNRAGAGAMNAFEQSIDDAAKAAKTNAGALKMHNGELDLGSQKARDAESALRDLAANTDDAAAKAREQGKSWEYVQGILSRGQDTFVETAQKMGLTKVQAEALAKSYLDIPDSKTTTLNMRTEDAVRGLDSVIAAIKKTPDKKSVTVDALTTDAVNLLESLGFKVSRLKDGRFKVTAETGDAKDGLEAVERARNGLKNKTLTINTITAGAIRDLENLKTAVRNAKGKTITMNVPTAEGRRQLELLGFKIRSTKGKRVTVSVPTGTPSSQVAAIQAAINRLHGKSVTNTVTTKYYNVGKPGSGVRQLPNANGNIVTYASGGMRENHIAQIAKPGTWRLWAEDETGGESYIPLARSKRPRSRAIAEETVRRLGGDPDAIQWEANGGVIGLRRFATGGMEFTYSGTGASANRYTLSGLIGASNDKKGNFSLAIFTSKLRGANNALDSWRSNLARVASRAGQDVADALAAMGDDGIDLTRKMAYGSSKYINDMAAQLRNLAASAKASLGEYTSQLKSAVKDQTAFQSDLAKLAAMGFGDLAKRLAEQNDADAAAVAHQAAKDKTKAAAANAAAKSANNALSSDQLAQLVQIIAAITTSKTGIHQVAAITGLGEDEIIATAAKARSQISSSLGSRAAQFLSDLSRAQKGLAYANGGIRAGLYATRGGLVRFAEPETGGEAYIPLGANKRSAATNVLGDVAHRFGLGITPAGDGGRVVIIREQGPLVGTQNWHVTSGGNAAETAARVDADNAYQLRRLARGGVGAR